MSKKKKKINIDVSKIAERNSMLLNLYNDPNTSLETKQWMWDNLYNPNDQLFQKYDTNIQQYLINASYGYLKGQGAFDKPEESDDFRWNIPTEWVTMINPDALKIMNLGAGDSLQLTSNEMNDLKSLLKRDITPEGFKLKKDDKTEYLEALNNFKDGIENELWDSVDIYKNTLTSIRPEVKDSLNNVIKVAKNPKIPQAKKDGFFTRAWNSFSTAWDKQVKHYKPIK